MQAVGFRDVYEKTASADAIMLGVSTDSVEKLRNFGDRLGLPFLLASDATGTAVTPIWPCFGSENRPDRFVGRNRRNMTHNGRCGTSVAVKDRPGAPRLGFLARSLAQATPRRHAIRGAAAPIAIWWGGGGASAVS